MKRPEQSLQRACAEIMQFVPKPPVGPWWTAINPVPAKSKAVAGISKAMGMRAGVPDFVLIYQERAIFIEFKSQRGGMSRAQRDMRDELEAAGGVVCEVRSVEDFMVVLWVVGIPCRVKCGNT